MSGNRPARQPLPLPAPRERQGVLPAVASEAGVPAMLTEDAAIVAELDALVNALPLSRRGTFADLDALRRTAPTLETLRTRFAALDQPATADEIAREALRLTVSVAVAGNIEPGVLADALCDALVELRPTRFELRRASRHVIKSSRFLSAFDVVTALKRCRTQADRYRRALGADIPALIAKTEQARVEEKRSGELAEMRRGRERAEADLGAFGWGDGDADEEGGS